MAGDGSGAAAPGSGADCGPAFARPFASAGTGAFGGCAGSGRATTGAVEAAALGASVGAATGADTSLDVGPLGFAGGALAVAFGAGVPASRATSKPLATTT